MAVGDVYESIDQVLAIAWVYCIYFNPYWFWIVGSSAWSKYCLQGYTFCPTGAGIRYGNLSAAHRRSSYVVEDAGDDIDLIRIIAGKCKDGAGGKASINPTLAPIVSINLIKVCNALP